MKIKRIIIMGAAGRDFHNFNVHFRDDPGCRVVAFTATQIPNIHDRIYPPTLAGARYRRGIPIFPEAELETLIRRHRVDEVVHAYSDVSHEEVMHAASRAGAAGADFRIMGPGSTSLRSRRPVIAVTAVRTGAGKSPTSQYIVRRLLQRKLRVGVVRHPMPYGDLAAMAVQRFARYEDFERQGATIEEREEYEPYVRQGVVVWAGVDYRRILRRAEREADVILWDGGNNDIPFYAPDLYITIVDPHRPGHELRYHPGETNLRAAGVILIGKTGTARPADVATVAANIRAANPRAHVFRTDLEITADRPDLLAGRTALVIEDGPTLTHGGMSYGAGGLLARAHGARIANASRWAVGSIRRVYANYPHLRNVLPAMGYGEKQVRELEETIRRARVDVVVDGTPADLGRLLRIDQPMVQVEYALSAPPGFRRLLDEFAAGVGRG